MEPGFSYLVAYQSDGEVYAIFRHPPGATDLEYLKEDGWHLVGDDLTRFLAKRAWSVDEDEARDHAEAYGMLFAPPKAPLLDRRLAALAWEVDESEIVLEVPAGADDR